MFKVVVLSDCRVPTISQGGHGLGRLAHTVATQLKKRKYDVELWAGAGSKFNGKLKIHDNEVNRAKDATLALDTVYIDMSHYHLLSKHNPDYRVIDWILDGECEWTPPNAFVATEHDLKYYPAAKLLPMGVDVDKIPFVKQPQAQEYLAFAAKIHEAKGVFDAAWIHGQQPTPVRFIGERFIDIPLPHWCNELHGKAFFDFIGNAVGLLHPVKAPNALGGGLMPLEAAAMGVPSIVYEFASTSGHVGHCVSGFIVRDRDEMLDAVQDLRLLDRKACRQWVQKHHGIDVMMDAIEAQIDKTFKDIS